MGITGAILRIVAATIIAISFSALALMVVKRLGVDLKDLKQRSNPKLLGTAAVFNILFIVSVVVLLHCWDKAPLSTLGLRFNPNDVIFSTMSVIGSVLLGFIYVKVLNAVNHVEIGRNSLSRLNIKKLGSMTFGFGVLYIAALQEEIMFRGYFSFVLLPFGFYHALVISSLLFTIWHFLTNKVHLFQAVDWLLGGLMLFYVYWISGSVWVASLVHFSRNVTNVLIFGIAGKHSIIKFNTELKPRYKTIYMIAYSLIILLGTYLHYPLPN